jgi:hypothetical protein
MSKVTVDLENLGNLDSEIKLLEKKKERIIKDMEDSQKSILSNESNSEKKIAQAEQDLKIKIAEENAKIVSEHKTLDAREKDIQTREKEVAEVHKLHKALDSARISFKEDIDLTDKAKANYLEKEHKAQLLIDQYTKKLEELETLKN